VQFSVAHCLSSRSHARLSGFGAFVAGEPGSGGSYLRHSFGWPTIHINGTILQGDEDKFARIAARYGEGTVVSLDSRGGDVVVAVSIGQKIWTRNFDTWLSANAEMCGSACTYIWLSGRHAVVQLNSALCFHQPHILQTGETAPTELLQIVAQYLEPLA
jgi:hypothetical protein